MKDISIYDVKLGNIHLLEFPTQSKEAFLEKLFKKIQNLESSNSDSLIVTTKTQAELILERNTLDILFTPTPPIPKPESHNKFPPLQSQELIVSTNPVDDLYVQHEAYLIPIFPARPNQGEGYYDPPFPTNTYLQYSTYWEQVRNGPVVITGPQTYTNSISYTTGMSETNSSTFSAKLGISISKLSAELSRTTGHSIVITNQKTITDKYEIPVSDEQTTVHILWQLVQKFIIVDDNGEPIKWSGIGEYHHGPFQAMGRFFFPNDVYLNKGAAIYSHRTNFDQ